MKRNLVDDCEEDKAHQAKRERIDSFLTEKINEVESDFLNDIKALKAIIEQGNFQTRSGLHDQKTPTPIGKDSSKERYVINTREKDAHKELADETEALLRNTERLQHIKSFAAEKACETNKEDLRTIKKDVAALKSEIIKIKDETEDIETKKLPAINSDIKRQSDDNKRNKDNYEMFVKQENKLKAKKKALSEVEGKLADLSKTYSELEDKINSMKVISHM